MYRVLARAYRPGNFTDLIGQEVLVRTLTNAIKLDRIAHAFLLTGIRGIGKTTTARIMARALNCIGAEEQGTTPTASPCGVCTHCKMIAESNHPDVIEMDAASRTGVNDIRDLIETVHYAPGTARYKVYIIDEVHMLSNSAFNALLKTLEEPPPHVKFIFATTEVRKIPVTILSRCQRFDLKRVDQKVLEQHLENIARKEQVVLEPEALSLLAMAAEGSVRDSLSLLDQAIAHHHTDATTPILAEAVRGMLGMADRSHTLHVLEAMLKGDIPSAIQQFQDIYKAGIDPLLFLHDALEMVHLMTRIHVVPEAAGDVAYAEHERVLAKQLSDTLSMPVLTRTWQMLLKGMQEARLAPQPAQAVEMVLTRITYAAQLPTPEEALKDIKKNSIVSLNEPSSAPLRSVEAQEVSMKENTATLSPSDTLGNNIHKEDIPPVKTLASFSELISLCARRGEMALASKLRQFASLVSFSPPEIVLFFTHDVGRECIAKLKPCLEQWTGKSWQITLSDTKGLPTLHEAEKTRKENVMNDAKTEPLVRQALEAFPGAEVIEVVDA